MRLVLHCFVLHGAVCLEYLRRPSDQHSLEVCHDAGILCEDIPVAKRARAHQEYSGSCALHVRRPRNATGDAT